MEPIADVINKIVKRRNLGDPEKIQKQVMTDPSIQKFIKDHRQRVNDAMLKNSLPNLFEYYTQKHSENKVMAGYRPELFLNGKVIDVRYVPTTAKIASDHEKILSGTCN